MAAKSSGHVPSEHSENSEIETALSDLAWGLRRAPRGQSQFTMPVTAMSEDGSSATVKLCTGGTLDIPTSLLKNVTYLGRVQNGDERLVIASGEVDVSTEAGRLLQQAAKEIGRLSVSLQASQNRLRRLLQAGNGTLAQSDEVPPSAVPIEVVPFDRTLPTASVKLQFWAVAGTPHYVVYEPPADYEYILQWSLTGLYNCYLTEKPYPQGWITGHPTWLTGIIFVLEAAHGTPLGTTYFASLTLNVVIGQQTT